MPKDKLCLVEMKLNSFVIQKYILQSQLNQFIQENPQYEYIKIVPEKVKTKVRKKD
jgi:hypothetical protein